MNRHPRSFDLRSHLPTLVIAFALAGCGGAATTPAPAGQGRPAASAPVTGGAGGGAKAVGYDCETLISPAELDKASGLKGGQVSTMSRGDEPPQGGGVMGVTECIFDYGFASVTWGGAFAIYTGPALQNYGSLSDLVKSQGFTPVDGLGAEAAVKTERAGQTNMLARGANGIIVPMNLSWDPTATSDQAVRDAMKQILTTVLSRT